MLKTSCAQFSTLQNTKPQLPLCFARVFTDAMMMISSSTPLPTQNTLVWLVQNLAGIQQQPHSVAFSHLLLAPRVPQGAVTMGPVECAFDGPRGVVLSHWEVVVQAAVAQFRWRVVVPPNSVARVRLPKNGTELDVGSGEWSFVEDDFWGKSEVLNPSLDR